MMRGRLAVIGGTALVAACTTIPPQYCGPAAHNTADEVGSLQERLATHLMAFSRERRLATNPDDPRREVLAKNLDEAAEYIRSQLAGKGEVVPQRVATNRSRLTAHNLELIIPGTTDLPAIVIGAHYDSAAGTPGVNDNGSGAAALIELALSTPGKTYKRDVRFVFFANEEEPFFGTEDMGSAQYVKRLRGNGTTVKAMVSLETLLYYTRAKESQCLVPRFDHQSLRHDPPPAARDEEGGAFLPRVDCAVSGSWLGDGFDVGDFVAFVGTFRGAGLMREALQAFCSANPDMKAAGVAVLGVLREKNPVLWSDHRPFVEAGIPAIMVTDTAPLRFPYYHSERDGKGLIERFKRPYARVVLGLRRVVTHLANSP